ncbi:hypothetical protein [Nocardia wallacei]|uniref:hypothetical protein n=1 Tax=Nocardia wallacei TaxID=480035 RepID=UPI002457A6F1|nr:hypothetical protein [Nocardia wallacei]
MPANVQKLGPGTLKLGPSATALDISCQAVSVTLAPDKDTEDPITVLCGDTIPGASTYAWKLSGTLLTDLSKDGLVQYTWENQNKAVAFEFVPSTAAATAFKGTVVVDPLAVGGDSGKNLQADFEWGVVGTPTPTFPTKQATVPAPLTYTSTPTFPTAAAEPGGRSAKE